MNYNVKSSDNSHVIELQTYIMRDKNSYHSQMIVYSGQFSMAD